MITSNLFAFVVCKSGSFGRGKWLKGNGPQPDVIWARSWLDAQKQAVREYWPYSVGVHELTKMCDFHGKLCDIPTDSWVENPWANPR